jgi:spermidine/putrescine transport system substrate-binding protein
MKRFFSLIILFLIAAILPLGCSANNANINRQNILSIYNWSTYIAPEILTEFEQKYDAVIKYDTYESSEELYAKVKPGNPGYDVAFPADYMVKIMAEEGLLEPLNKENLPNIKNLNSKFIDPPFDPGNQYSLPYQWGTMGIGYNFQNIGEKINSWSALFQPKYKGKVALVDDMRGTFAIALISLGYDPNTTNPEEIAKARDFLIQNKETIAVFAPDTGQQLLDQGQVDSTSEWSGDIFKVMEENPNLDYVIPKEGSVIFTDNMVILKNAPNKELAEKFINFLMEPEIAAQNSNFIKYGSPNQAAIEQGLINKEDLNNPAIYPPPEVLDKLYYLKDVGQATILYDEAWTEVKVAAGN